ncbi:MAG: ARMT1-like domain-containing protein [Chthoniobacteraceae bacterium]
MHPPTTVPPVSVHKRFFPAPSWLWRRPRHSPPFQGSPYPVLNDATLPDAEQAGLPGFCKLLSNGSDAPSTLLGDCSPEFRAHFEAADLIIAKGQGNYESLVDTQDPRIFFLLKVKCPVLAGPMGCPCGSLLLRNAAFPDEVPNTHEQSKIS